MGMGLCGCAHSIHSKADHSGDIFMTERDAPKGSRRWDIKPLGFYQPPGSDCVISAPTLVIYDTGVGTFDGSCKTFDAGDTFHLALAMAYDTEIFTVMWWDVKMDHSQEPPVPATKTFNFGQSLFPKFKQILLKTRC